MAKRKNYKRRGRGNSNSDDAMAGLSQLLGLSLGLFAFDAMLDAVLPTLYSCGSGFVLNETTISIGTTLCYNATNVTQTASADGGWFSVVITLVIALIPVFGILGAYAIIKKTIKKLKL